MSPPSKRRKRSPPASLRQHERASKSAALERGLTRDRGDLFSPFASRPPRNRFEHYPPPPDDAPNDGNCPMKFVFKYASIDKPITQARTHYVTSPSYQMKMEDGWITVMDPVDDMLMLHSVVFEKDNGEPDDYRIAWVYHNLKVEKDFYVEHPLFGETTG